MDKENNLPELNTSGLSMEEQFTLVNFKMSIDRCQDLERMREVCKQMVDYYIRSQNLIKTLALDKLNSEMPKAEKQETILNAKKIIKEAKKRMEE